MCRFIPVIIALLALIAPANAQSAPTLTKSDNPDTIVWLDYARGTETAKAENKPMLIYFYRDSCPYCQKLKLGALVDTALADYLNENFIPIRINTESRRQVGLDSLRITESQLANEKWMVRGVPCMWLLEPDGCRIKKLGGLKACSNVLADLQQVVAKSYGDCPNLPLAAQRKVAATDTTKKSN